MGAVQKLATVVIIGMVAMSALLVVYLADEPNRMAAESVEKEEIAIERGVSHLPSELRGLPRPGR